MDSPGALNYTMDIIYRKNEQLSTGPGQGFGSKTAFRIPSKSNFNFAA